MENTTNASISADTGPNQVFPAAVRYSYIVYYIIIFLLATVGNIFALLTCYKSYRETTSVLLCFIASLSSADLLFTLLTPIDLAAFLAGAWVSGKVLCPVQSFLIESSYTASILTLAAISHERLVAVSSPLLARSQRVNQRKFIPLLIWALSLVLCSPLLYAYRITSGDGSPLQCVNTAWGNKGRQIYYSIQGVSLFIVPLSYMSWAHYKIFKSLKKHQLARARLASKTPSLKEGFNEKKITKMLAIVTLIFVACYFPFLAVRSLRYFHVYSGDMVWRCVQLMIFTQAAVNPVIYCFYSKQFRGVFKELLRCRWAAVNRKKTEQPLRSRSRTSSSVFQSGSVHLNVIYDPEKVSRVPNGLVEGDRGP
ncbi:QRFP-like peptide receptor [Nematostella vectensis]|uniref:QRFP-like peptide receptor n=1 Tax=Nematostella vectensis TaxID=45351 RepID=UPI0013901C1D|nr:QRFP-like peptide receptor [Nematostella vectensis]